MHKLIKQLKLKSSGIRMWCVIKERTIQAEYQYQGIRFLRQNKYHIKNATSTDSTTYTTGTGTVYTG